MEEVVVIEEGERVVSSISGNLEAYRRDFS